jgi:GT2 family glycosyltransferase
MTVAALDRQTYPSQLLSVVVVDDGSDPPLRPPAAHRVRVEMARQERSGFGIARARNLGAELASGDILIFLDSDMIPEPQWAEAHARWHHLVGDALTLGFRRHVEVSGLTAADVGIAAESGSLDGLFAGRRQERPEWIEFHLERTSELTRPETDLFRVVTGGNLGVRRDTILELGGFDTGFDRWGAEDTELGYRAFTWGALLVPERAAAAWHQGLGTLPDPGEARALEEQRSLLAHLIAEPSFRPRVAGRSYRVPMVVVRVDGSEAAAGDVAGSVESAVGSRLHDLVVSLIVPDTHPDAVWLRRRFEGDPRVLTSDRPDDMERVPFAPVRVMLPAGARLARAALDRLLDRLRGRGAVEVPLGSATLVAATTAALRREERRGSPHPWLTVEDRRRVPARRVGVSSPPPNKDTRRELPGTSPVEKVLRRASRIRSPHDAAAAGRWAWTAARRRADAWMAARRQTEEPLETRPPEPRVAVAGTPVSLPGAFRVVGGLVEDPVPDLVVVGPDAALAPQELSRVASAGGVVVFSGIPDPEGRGRIAPRRDTLPAVDPVEFGLRLAGIAWRPVARVVATESPTDVRSALEAAARLGLAVELAGATAPGTSAFNLPAHPAGWAESLRSARVVFDHAGLHDSIRSRAVNLARMAAAAAPLVVDGLDSVLASLVGDRLVEALAKVDPEGWDHPTTRERWMVDLRRAALIEHGSAARFRHLMAAGGGSASAPSVSVLLATNRPEQIEHAIGQLERQSYSELEVVIGLHGPAAARSPDLPGDIKVIEADASLTLGEVLQMAVEASSGELLSKVDDDDWYGPDHIWDLVLARELSGAALVGKGSEFVHLASSEATIRRFIGGADTWTTTIGGGALLIGRQQLDRIGGWQPVPRSVDRALIEDVHRAGGRVYRTHGFGYVLERRGSGHTWDADDTYFLEQAEMSWPGLALDIAGVE